MSASSLLSLEIGSERVEFLDDDGEEGLDTVVDDKVEELDGLLVVELQLELVVDFADGFVRFQRDVRNVGLQHQREQVENQIRVSAQVQVGGVAVLLEGLEVLGSVATHGLDHLLAQLHLRRERFRVPAEDEPEIHVEKFSASRQQQVVIVSIAHAQNVRDDAVSEGGGRNTSMPRIKGALKKLFRVIFVRL